LLLVAAWTAWRIIIKNKNCYSYITVIAVHHIWEDGH
jgi:hypothetical protein